MSLHLPLAYLFSLLPSQASGYTHLSPLLAFYPTLAISPSTSRDLISAAYQYFLKQAVQVTKSESEVSQSCPTLCDPKNCSLPRSSVHGIFQARVLENHFLLQGIFPTQGSNTGLPHYRQMLYRLSHKGQVGKLNQPFSAVCITGNESLPSLALGPPTSALATLSFFFC